MNNPSEYKAFAPERNLIDQVDDLSPLDLFKALYSNGTLTSKHLEELRRSVQKDQQGNGLIAFLNTPVAREHVRNVLLMRGERPHLTPEAVHHTILAQRLTAERLKRQQGETREQAEETMSEFAS